MHSPKRNIVSDSNDPVVQLVRMPPCHGGGRGFESRPDRKKFTITFQKIDPVVQLVRMPPCHGGGRGFESRPDREVSQCNWETFFLDQNQNGIIMDQYQNLCLSKNVL